MSASGVSTGGDWTGDHLGRKDEATYLTGYLAARYTAKASEAGFVLAVNGEWGMGKSFMLERWSKDMEHAGHPVVSFNAWENDFTAEPLVAFIAELDKALGPYFKNILHRDDLHKQWYEQAKAVLVPCLKVAGMAALKHAAGLSASQLAGIWSEDDEQDEATAGKGGGADTKKGPSENRSETAGKEEGDHHKFDTKGLGEKLNKAVEETLKSHNNTKRAIGTFKDRLGNLIRCLGDESHIQLPVCVFIDELDRCRPDYAIRLLEGIKHLFGVPGLHFIVATNLTELAHSVRAVYGSGFSAERYLKRFFDMEYALPQPDSDQFAEQLTKPLADLTASDFITGFETLYDAGVLAAKGLPYVFYKYAEGFELSLRDQLQAARILEVALLSFNNREVHLHFLVFLVTLYQRNSQTYHKVARERDMSEATGFALACPRVRLTEFMLPSERNSGDQKLVALTDIANVYFDFLNGRRSHSEVSDDDFPANLHQKMVKDSDPAKMANYLEIVRHAGRFSR